MSRHHWRSPDLRWRWSDQPVPKNIRPKPIGNFQKSSGMAMLLRSLTVQDKLVALHIRSVAQDTTRIVKLFCVHLRNIEIMSLCWTTVTFGKCTIVNRVNNKDYPTALSKHGKEECLFSLCSGCGERGGMEDTHERWVFISILQSHPLSAERILQLHLSGVHPQAQR